jgi:hypothetical protein
MATLPTVNSVDEEYRYIQFHRFECGCAGPARPALVVGSHGIGGDSLWFLKEKWRLVTRISDSIEASCPGCGGRFVYRFDILPMAHIAAMYWRFGLYRLTAEGILMHMALVMDVRRRLASAGLPGLTIGQ